MHGFAGRCLTTRPLHHWGLTPVCTFRADDGIRTRDPHLGKVMRYQLRYIREPWARSSPTAKSDNSARTRSGTNPCVRLLYRPYSAEMSLRANLRPRQVATVRCARRSRGSVGERPLHTRKVAGSIPAGTTTNPLLEARSCSRPSGRNGSSFSGTPGPAGLANAHIVSNTAWREPPCPVRRLCRTSPNRLTRCRPPTSRRRVRSPTPCPAWRSSRLCRSPRR